MHELDMLDMGMVWDMITEKDNNNYNYPIKAGQDEFNEFLKG